MELSGHLTNVCLIFWGIIIRFYTVTVPVHVHSINVDFLCSDSLKTPAVFWFCFILLKLIAVVLVNVKWYLIVTLIYIPLITMLWSIFLCTWLGTFFGIMRISIFHFLFNQTICLWLNWSSILLVHPGHICYFLSTLYIYFLVNVLWCTKVLALMNSNISAISFGGMIFIPILSVYLWVQG